MLKRHIVLATLVATVAVTGCSKEEAKKPADATKTTSTTTTTTTTAPATNTATASASSTK